MLSIVVDKLIKRMYNRLVVGGRRRLLYPCGPNLEHRGPLCYDGCMKDRTIVPLCLVLFCVLISMAQVARLAAQSGHEDTQSGNVGNTSTGTVGVGLIIPPKSTGVPVEDAAEQFKGIPHEKVVVVGENGITTVIYVFE